MSGAIILLSVCKGTCQPYYNGARCKSCEQTIWQTTHIWQRNDKYAQHAVHYKLTSQIVSTKIDLLQIVSCDPHDMAQKHASTTNQMFLMHFICLSIELHVCPLLQLKFYLHKISLWLQHFSIQLVNDLES